MNTFRIASVLFATFLGTSSGAAVLTFDSAVDCSSPDPNVTLSIIVGTPCEPFANPGLGTPGLGLYGPGMEVMRADFGTLVNTVSVDLGGFVGQDSDATFLEIYSMAGTLLRVMDFIIPANVSVMNTLSVSSATPVAYALFGNRADGGFIAIDNLSYSATGGPTMSEVPLPASGFLMLTALLGAGFLRQRRSA